MFRFDVNHALQDYFPPLFDAVRECTAAFRAVSSSHLVKVKRMEKYCGKRRRPIPSSLDQRLWSSICLLLTF